MEKITIKIAWAKAQEKAREKEIDLFLAGIKTGIEYSQFCLDVERYFSPKDEIKEEINYRAALLYNKKASHPWEETKRIASLLNVKVGNTTTLLDLYDQLMEEGRKHERKVQVFDEDEIKRIFNILELKDEEIYLEGGKNNGK